MNNESQDIDWGLGILGLFFIPFIIGLLLTGKVAVALAFGVGALAIVILPALALVAVVALFLAPVYAYRYIKNR